MIREASVTPTPSAIHSFGAAELRSAIAGVSDSLQELEASDLGISLADLGLEGESITDLVVFAVSDPFQLVFGREWACNRL